MKWYEKNKSIKKVIDTTRNVSEDHLDSGSNFDEYFSDINLEDDLSTDEFSSNSMSSKMNLMEDTSEIKTEPIISTPQPVEKVNIAPAKEMKVSTIQSETKVLGDIVCDGHLTVYGSIKGNIDCVGDLHIFGNVQGLIHAGHVIIEDCIYYGNLTCTDLTLNNVNTVVHGNIKASNVVSLGRIKGNVDVENRFRLGCKGAVIGDISASSMSLEEGAIVQGKVMINQDIFIDELEEISK